MPPAHRWRWRSRPEWPGPAGDVPRFRPGLQPTGTGELRWSRMRCFGHVEAGVKYDVVAGQESRAGLEHPAVGLHPATLDGRALGRLEISHRDLHHSATRQFLD